MEMKVVVHPLPRAKSQTPGASANPRQRLPPREASPLSRRPGKVRRASSGAGYGAPKGSEDPSWVTRSLSVLTISGLSRCGTR